MMSPYTFHCFMFTSLLKCYKWSISFMHYSIQNIYVVSLYCLTKLDPTQNSTVAIIFQTFTLMLISHNYYHVVYSNCRRWRWGSRFGGSLSILWEYAITEKRQFSSFGVWQEVNNSMLWNINWFKKKGLVFNQMFSFVILLFAFFFFNSYIHIN
jgi:hypothetical protein